MDGVVNVFEVQSIYNAMEEINQIKEESFRTCDEGMKQARQTLEETQSEEQTSKAMLNVGKEIEMLKHARVIELEVELAAAVAELTAVTPNLVAMATTSARIAEIESQLIQARQEYEEAIRHREALEQRYDMALKCVNLAQERLETLQMKFELNKRNIDFTVIHGISRMNMAYEDLIKYIARITPEIRNHIDKWFNEKPKEKELIKPNEIRNRLDVSNSVIDALLEYLYITDLRFRTSIDNYCNEIKLGDVVGVELKIKKNMVGRLCEELVIRSFKPISTQIVTQRRETLPDGSYTKVDMIVYGLTNPIILGRGEGMGTRAGGSLGVEVKSGHSAYLYSQLNHMLNQAIGHEGCDISCVICTRDIHDLSNEKENELREKLRKAGSPIIGLLPRKDNLDTRCIEFVKGKMKDV